MISECGNLYNVYYLFSSPFFSLTTLMTISWNSPALLLAMSDQQSSVGTKAKPIWSSGFH